MNQRFLHRPALWTRPVTVVFFRDVFRDQDRILTHRTHAVRKLFCSVELHFFLLVFGRLIPNHPALTSTGQLPNGPKPISVFSPLSLRLSSLPLSLHVQRN